MTIKMIEIERCCRNCEFWEGKDNWGRCHRYPPQFWSEGEESGACHVGTSDTEWCGEFKAIDKWIVPEGTILDKPGPGVLYEI